MHWAGILEKAEVEKIVWNWIKCTTQSKDVEKN